jgi:hypothetical protein
LSKRTSKKTRLLGSRSRARLAGGVIAKDPGPRCWSRCLVPEHAEGGRLAGLLLSTLLLRISKQTASPGVTKQPRGRLLGLGIAKY